MSPSERRRWKRVPFFCEAQLEGIDVARANVRLSDISVAGAFVDTRTVLPPGLAARLRFSLSGREISVTVEVRYSMAGMGMGLRFLDLADEDREAISTYVAGQAGATN